MQDRATLPTVFFPPESLRLLRGKKEEHIDQLHIGIDIYLVKCYCPNSKYTTEADTKLAVLLFFCL